MGTSQGLGHVTVSMTLVVSSIEEPLRAQVQVEAMRA